jgi:5-methylcytosine-specific restriction endonuclease McrA
MPKKKIKVVKMTKKLQKKLDKRAEKKQFQEWARIVKEDSFFKCAICGSPTKLNSHHIIPRDVHEYRFDTLNGVALCGFCHKFSITNSPHRNPFVFFLWLRDNHTEQFKYLEELIKQKRKEENV